MKTLEGKLENGKRAMFNAERIDAIIETEPKKTVICLGAASYTVMASYDEIARSGLRGEPK